MTEVDYYNQILLAIAAERAAVSLERKLTYSVGGRSFSWTQYLDYLDKSAKTARENLIAAEGPTELYVTGTP